MEVRTFLDEGKVLEIIFKISDQNIDYDIVSHTKKSDKELGKVVIENLKNDIEIKQTENPDLYKVLINGQDFIDLTKTTGEIENINSLTGFETRTLGQRDDENIPFARDDRLEFSPKTDLHTHFAGALTPESLIKVGKEHDIDYNKDLLEKIGIDTSKYNIHKNQFGQDCIKLKELDQQDIEELNESLKISPVTQETFNKMEEIYNLRGPFTKNKELFPDYLKQLAEDYKKEGVEYVELSLSSIIDSPEDMKMLEDNLPQIEEDTGVKLRFLGSLWRHSDREWNDDEVDRLIKVAESPYVVGYDLMGMETNPTLIFEEQLKTLAKYAMKNDPEFTIRVHAGENERHKDNVKDVLKFMLEAHENLQDETGEQCPLPKVRIGHGIYGVDEETISMAKKLNAIIEFNMSSNLALNNINSISDIPIKEYIDEELGVVLGTDGHGMYSTTSKQETILAMAAGLTLEDLKKIRTTEENVIKRAERREQSHNKIEDVNSLYGNNVEYKEGQYSYNDETEKKYKEYNDKVLKDLKDSLEDIAETDKEEIKRVTEGKIPIVLTGASKSQWKEVQKQDSEEDTKYTTEYIPLLTQVLANVLDPQEAYVVTGGTNFGVEKTLHEAVNTRNNREDEQLVLLGTFVKEALTDIDRRKEIIKCKERRAQKGLSSDEKVLAQERIQELESELSDGIEPNTITHATILEQDGVVAENWGQLPETQLELVRKNKGVLLAIAGSLSVNDMIQKAHNQHLDMLIMDGPVGASTDKSRALEGNNYSFKTVEEFLTMLHGKNKDIFVKNFSLDDIDTYISQAKEDIRSRNYDMDCIAKIDEEVDDKDRKSEIIILNDEVHKLKDDREKPKDYDSRNKGGEEI